MCVTEIFVDRYPNGVEVDFRQTRLCQYGRPGRVCETHSTLENPVRNIQFGEPTSEFILTQLNTPPRSSTSSQRPSSLVEIAEESPKPKKKRQSSLFLSAFFGDPPRRRHSQKEKVVFVNTPPSPRRARTPPPRTVHWSEPRSPRTPPFVYDASPPRVHHADPIIHDSRRRPGRPSSVDEIVASRGSGRRHRSPSPPSFEERRRRQEREEERERRRRRDERAARLEAEVLEARNRRRRAEYQERQNAEINARPAVLPPPLRRRQFIRPVVERSDRLHELLRDMDLSDRGERVIAEAVAERRRRDDLTRAARAEIEADEIEAQRERLRSRFTVGGSGSGRWRRDRVFYDDGTFRYD